MNTNWSVITEGPFREHGKDETISVQDECHEVARTILQNWVQKARWGLPDSVVAEMLEEESKNLRAN